MSRFTPTDITSTYAAIAALNTNFTEIQSLLDEMLSRTGDGTNSMQTNLDMNHFSIQNLGAPVNSTDAIRLTDLQTTMSTSGGALGAWSHDTTYPNGTIGLALKQNLTTLTGTNQYSSFNEAGNQQGYKVYYQADMVNKPGDSLNHLNAVALTAAIDTGVSASNQGSTISFASRNIVWNSDDGTGFQAGSNREFTVGLNILRAKTTGSNKWGNYWLCDWTVTGPAYNTDTTKREQFMGGVVFARKLTQGTSTGSDAEGVGKTFWGSCVMSFTTNAQSLGGGTFGAEDQLPTYTMNCGIDVSGWAGPWGTSNGTSPSAIEAFLYGVKVGGQPINPWSPQGVRSRIGTGVYIQDWTGYAINAENGYSSNSGLARFAGSLGTHIINSQGLPQVTEAAAASVTTPPSGSQVLFIDTADHKLKRKDSSGTVTIIG